MTYPYPARFLAGLPGIRQDQLAPPDPKKSQEVMVKVLLLPGGGEGSSNQQHSSGFEFAGLRIWELSGKNGYRGDIHGHASSQNMLLIAKMRLSNCVSASFIRCRSCLLCIQLFVVCMLASDRCLGCLCICIPGNGFLACSTGLYQALHATCQYLVPCLHVLQFLHPHHPQDFSPTE